MSKKRLLLLTLALTALSGAASVLQAQKLPTATKLLDIQAGGDFVYGKSDYASNLRGYGFYGTIDFRQHFGLMLDFHQANEGGMTYGNVPNTIYERTYEVGGRYVRHYGRFDPYAKLMIGRGVFNGPPDPFNPAEGASFNLAYNMFAIGGGVDYKLKRYLNLRGDYEYQFWKSGPGIVNGLTPQLVSVGVAYHFH